MVKDQHPQAVKEATASVLPVWLEAFKVLLLIDPQQDVSNSENWDGLAIRIQIFKVRHGLIVNIDIKHLYFRVQTLDTIHTSFPRVMTTYLQDFLSASLQHLQVLFLTFTHFYLSPSASPPGSSEDERVGLPHLVCPLIDFVSTVTRGGKVKEWFDAGNLQGLVGAVFNYVQMTEDDVSDLFPDWRSESLRIDLNRDPGLCHRKILGLPTPMLLLRKRMTRPNHIVSGSQGLTCLV
jgi:hypothetical protein